MNHVYKPKHRKTRNSKGVLITAAVFLIAGSIAVAYPILEDNRQLQREEAEYEELAEELKMPDEMPFALSADDVQAAPVTEPEKEEPDTTAIHPPNEDENSEIQGDEGIQMQTEATITPELPDATIAPGQRPSTDVDPSSSVQTGNSGANLSACVAKNHDFVAWLKIPGTNVDYPVVLTDSPDYYLTNSFTGKVSKLGTLFSLGKTDYQTPGKNIAIYGHHITNTSSCQKMFRPLLSYKQKSFWEKHQTVYLDSLYHISTYRVFAVIDMVNGEWDPSTAAFSSDYAFLDFIRQAQSQSLYDTGVTVSAGDHILTLITCDRSFASKEGRLVVMAVEQ